MKMQLFVAAGLILLGSVGDVAEAGSANVVEVVTKVGQSAPGAPKGSTIASLNSAFTDSNGKVGFIGTLDSDVDFVWYDTGIIWLNSDAPPEQFLSNAESTMGVSASGGFVYNPSVNFNDSVWTDLGPVFQEGDAAPGIPDYTISFVSRTTMVPDGTVHWISGAEPNGSGPDLRALYRWTRDTGEIVSLLKSGDIVGGLVISTSTGLTSDYDISDNLTHHIHRLDTTAPTTNDGIVYLDGTIAMREGNPTIPAGELWSNFGLVSVNNSGNYVVEGDTNGNTATDEFIAYNGTIVAREGQSIDGVFLPIGSSVRALSINNNDRVVHLWAAPTLEVLFVGDAPTLGTSSVRLLGTGDLVDTNGDDVLDHAISDVEAGFVLSPLGISLSDHDWVYVEVTLNDGQNEFEAIVRVPLSGGGPACPADVAPPGGSQTVDVDDLLLVINSWGDCLGCAADIFGNGVVNVDDLLEVINSWGDC